MNNHLDGQQLPPIRRRITMHSSLVRIQTVFGFFTSVAFAVAAAVALSVFLNPQAPTADVKVKNVQVYVDSARMLSGTRLILKLG